MIIWNFFIGFWIKFCVFDTHFAFLKENINWIIKALYTTFEYETALKRKNFFLSFCLRITFCNHQRPGRTKLLYPNVQYYTEGTVLPPLPLVSLTSAFPPPLPPLPRAPPFRNAKLQPSKASRVKYQLNSLEVLGFSHVETKISRVYHLFCPHWDFNLTLR